MSWVSTAAAFVTGLAALLGAALPAAADVTVDTRFGHGGAWVSDFATPVEVTLRNTSPAPVQVRIAVRQGGFGEAETFVVERSVPVGGNSARRETFVVPGPSGWSPEVTVDIETSPSVPVHGRDKTGDRGRLSIDVSNAMNTSTAARPDRDRIVGVVGDGRSILASRFEGRELLLHPPAKIPPDLKGVPVRALGVDEENLRLAPLGLGGIESLVVCDPDASFCDEPAHLDALLDWVALGGHLVVSLGESAPQFASSPLAEWMPARWGRVERANYADIAGKLSQSRDAPLPRTGPLLHLEATASGTKSSLPVPAMERRFGDGRIVLLGIDVRALAESAPSDDVSVAALAELLVPRLPMVSWDRSQPWRNELRVGEPLGQILRQDAFHPPPLPAVLLGLFVYVLVVGPLDWLVLRRLRKERLTTLTFAGSVIVFTVIAYGASFLLFSSNRVVNRITFVHFAGGGRPGRELVRWHDLVGFYEPTSGTRELIYPTPAVLLGRSLPGVHSSGVGSAGAVLVRGNDPVSQVGEVDVAFRSQRNVFAQGAGPTGRTVDAQQDGDAVVVTNTLPVDLTSCWILRKNEQAIWIGAIPAGGSGRGREATSPGLDLRHGDPSNWTEASSPDARVDGMRRFLTDLATAALNSDQQPEAYETLRASGVCLDAPARGRALLIACAAASPFPLPGSTEDGTSYIVITKEVDFK